VAVKDLTAAACHKGTWFLRRHPLAGVPHRIFPRGPIPLSAPGLKIRFRPIRQKHSPRILEIEPGPGRNWQLRRRYIPQVTAGIEAARPAPRIFMGRNAGPDRDRADAHVTILDVPAFFGGLERAAAGELGHALSKRHRTAGTIPLPLGPGAAYAHDLKLTETAMNVPNGRNDTVRINR
jgi:hypothetical protein